MTEQERLFVQELVKATVRETIRELKRGGLLKSESDIAYTEATAILKSYYVDGETDTAVASALHELSDDPYYNIIPLYFRYGYTIERIAEYFDVEISTVSRNKKRLCLELYNLIE